MSYNLTPKATKTDWGEAQDFDGEKITYPHNDLRRLECERRGEYWLDAPDLGQGPVSPMPDAAIPGHLAFRPMTFEQIGFRVIP